MGTDDTARSNLDNINSDYGALEVIISAMGAQVVFGPGGVFLNPAGKTKELLRRY